MFKPSKNVPEIYMKESRDFQLMSRLNDMLFLGVHYDASSITELNNPKKCRSLYLKYLAEKVGFYTDKYIPDVVLMNIISAFKTALKNKGTLLGVEQAVIAVLKAENSIEPPRIVHVRGFNETDLYYEQYTINIYTPIKIKNEVALKEFLKYIIPAGYNYNLYVYETAALENKITSINNSSGLGILTASSYVLGTHRSRQKYDDGTLDTNKNDKIATDIKGSIDDTDYFLKTLTDRLIGAIDTSLVISKADYDKAVANPNNQTLKLDQNVAHPTFTDVDENNNQQQQQ